MQPSHIAKARAPDFGPHNLFTNAAGEATPIPGTLRDLVATGSIAERTALVREIAGAPGEATSATISLLTDTLAEDPSMEVRAATVVAIGALRPDVGRVVVPLAERLHPDGAPPRVVRRASAWALGALPGGTAPTARSPLTPLPAPHDAALL